jgi:hypothetical protein
MKHLRIFEDFTDYYGYDDDGAECYEVLNILGRATGYIIWMMNPEETKECEKRGWLKTNTNKTYNPNFILEDDSDEVLEFLEDFRYAKKHGIDVDIVKQSRKYNL